MKCKFSAFSLKLIIMIYQFIYQKFSGTHYLGHSAESIDQTSWYTTLHPDDVSMAAKKHKTCEFVDQVNTCSTSVIRLIFIKIRKTCWFHEISFHRGFSSNQ